ncbi:MAG: hypothetical protein KC910_16045 [Candidatus Eremiobacteraeota bacterium]|nr:hypothetical protein [Candidatus Eremiobacteraeota bacterium]
MHREAFWIERGNLRIVPILHEKVEFTRYVRLAIRETDPDFVAIELPPGIGKTYENAVARFPHLTYLANRAPEPSRPEAPPQDPFLFYRVEPTDPFAEAIRTAKDLSRAVHYVDLHLGYPSVPEPLPDTYSVYHLGLKAYWEEYRKTRPSFQSHLAKFMPQAVELDQMRERHMAYQVQQLCSRGRVVLVVGMAHVDGILKALEEGTAEPGEGLPEPKMKLFEPDVETIRSLSGEFPLIMTLHEFVRGGPGEDEFWLDPLPEPDEGVIQEGRGDPFARYTGKDAVSALESLLGLGSDRPDELELTPEQVKAISRYLMGIPDPHLSIESLLGDANAPDLEGAPQLARDIPVFKFKSCNERRGELRGIYEHLNGECRGEDGFLDRQKVFHHLCLLAGEFYEENTGDVFKRWQHRVLTQFARNYARVEGRLLPDLYQLVMCARGSVDHNYAYELWDLATFYPWAESNHGLPKLHIDGDTEGMEFRRWSFERRQPRLRQMGMRSRGEEKRPGEWKDAFRSGSICSYPPEDVVIEDYGRYLQKKSVLVMSEERTRVEPFSTSLLDGIDMRTTLRNWADGSKIYVKETQKTKGGTGSVVIIFDEDFGDQKFPWKMTWHGEHAQESDMAFYATNRFSKIIGPGIARCEYGGLMLTYPPRRLMDVWTDAYYRPMAKNKAEILLLAAIDYCLEKHVVYVAEKPPRSVFRTIASRLGKKIVYLPIGQLSPVSLKRIRVFHVLSGHHLRQIAKDYIW